MANPYQVTAGEMVQIDPQDPALSGGEWTINCPSSPSNGDHFWISNKTDNEDYITIDGNGKNIRWPVFGAATATLRYIFQTGVVQLVFDSGNDEWFPLSDFIGKSRFTTVTVSDVSYNTSYETVILCDCGSNDVTVNLPVAETNKGTSFVIKKLDSSSNSVIVSANGVELIDGSTTATIITQYESITIVCDGTEWWII